MPPSLLRVLTLVLIALPQLASAWDLSFIANDSLPSDFSPTLTTSPDAKGFWASGTANGMPILLRYNNDGTVNFSRYLSGSALYQGDIEQVFAIAAYPDGGVIDIDSVNSLGNVRCYMRRFDAIGRLRWAISEGAGLLGQTCLNTMQIDGAGNIWLWPGIHAISPDGTPLGYIQGLTVNGKLLADPHSEFVYVYGCVGNCYLDATSVTSTAAIEKITTKGHVWTVQTPTSTVASKLDSLIVGSDGNLYGYGRIASGPNNTTTLYGMGVTADGALRWEYTPTTEIANNDVQVAATSNGDSLVLYGDFANFLTLASNASPTIAKISSSGSLQWRHAAGFQSPLSATSNFLFGSSSLLVAANGDIVSALLYCSTSGSPTTCPFQQARLDAGGNTLYAGKVLGTDASSAMHLTTLPDSSSLAIKGTFQHLDRSGNVIASPQTTEAVQDASWNVAETIASDGSTYLLTADSNASKYAVTAYSQSGERQWRTVLAAITANGTPTQAIMVARSSDICLVGVIDSAQVVQCYSRSTGTPSTPVQLATSINPNTQRISAAALANDELLVLYGINGGSLRHALLDAKNHLLHDVAALNAGETWGITSINVNGSALIQTSTTSLVKFKSDGTRAYSITPDMSSYYVRLADDESTLLSQTAPSALIERLDAGGKLLWKSALPLLPNSTRIAIRSIKFSGSAVYFYLYDNPAINYAGIAAPRQGYVVKLAESDGHMEWNTSSTFAFSAFADIVVPPILLLDAASQDLLLLTSYARKIQLRKFSGSDGTELTTRNENMNVDGFSIYDLMLANDGTLTIVADTTDTVTGSAWEVVSLSHPFATAPPIRADQPGIAGSWYAPYSTGQGFTLDYIAGANTIFMPWFTFTQTLANDPSSNVWYTLQGQPTSGATTVDLKIYVADSPGVFNSGKTGAKQVGSAQLSFTDCSHASLQYQFDATTNLGLSGVITLMRLTPQATQCFLADGSTQTISVAAPAQGFDARQSGSWYDPGTSGQGVELTVSPAGNGSNGLLFGAWFTYDPSGAGNDPLNQHWFTLQSDLAMASNGKVTLPILQILGGTLDGMPTRNSSQVGTAVLTFTACDRAQLDYQFANSSTAHAYAGLSGSLHLSKLGGCTAP